MYYDRNDNIMIQMVMAMMMMIMIHSPSAATMLMKVMHRLRVKCPPR